MYRASLPNLDIYLCVKFQILQATSHWVFELDVCEMPSSKF
jgi:hypothetical protein